MYMLISPPQKAANIILVNITRKIHIKYLGVFIDEHLNWGPQILHINNKVSRNMGIMNKLTLVEIKYTLSILQVYFICTSQKKSTFEVYLVFTSRKKV